MAKRTAPTHDLAPAKVARTDGVRPTAKRTGGPPARSAATVANTALDEPRISPRQRWDQNESENVKLASQDVCDLYLYRNQDVKNTAVQKKPRSLLYNIAPDHSDMKDLMVSTSLKGDMQFWNAKSRTMIKTVGPEAFYDNAWIEEICWVTPTTLAMCKGHPKQGENMDSERVSLAHIDSVSGNDVKLRVQHLSDCPHEKGILAIAPIEIGHMGSIGVEHASIVTGVHTLCFDPVNQRLLTGGADAKIFTYDMPSQKTVTEMKIGHRFGPNK
ncbi:hypothetical protein BX666DRAFT_1179033 [Dichotomocladium elegans]|nr:hypothetical protein BX666DRAFT_1179033 [Dichotomocladium elegans]